MEICTVGGFEEVGKNMTALKIEDDVFIFDAGIYLPPVIEIQETEPPNQRNVYNEEKLRKIGALPDDLILDKMGWTDKVRAIIVGHAHFDHVAGVPYISHRYPQAQIIATPFTMAFFNALLEDNKLVSKNKQTILKSNNSMKIKGKSQEYTLEFVHITHSTIQCVLCALHSKEGTFFYALDYKFDNYPVMEPPPNYKRLKEIGKKGVKVLVMEALYSSVERRTPSERIARHMVEDAFSRINKSSSAIFISTFSSHIARLKSIVDFGRRTNRQIVFLGRSLNKYLACAIKVGECPFQKEITMIKYRNQVDSFLKKMNNDRGKYIVVCTGHQAEPGSILDRIASDETPFRFKEDDNVIFASSVIPATVNLMAREKMDKKLRKRGVRIQTDVHVSGHAGREDLRDMIEMLKPKYLIPAHGSLQQETPLVELAKEMGYKFGDTVQLASDGKVFKF